MCVAERRAQAADVITRVCSHWSEWRGPGCVYLATLTVRHGWSDELATTAHGVRDAWRALLGGRPWRALRERFGFELVTSEEVLHGRNGWHPHLHVLFLSERPLSETEALEVSSWLFERWATMVERHIGAAHAPFPDVGTDFRACHVETYIAKLGLELTDAAASKRGRGSTPLQLLERWESGEVRARMLYRDYASAMRGRRDLTWSRGLRVLRDLASVELKEDRARERDAAPLLCSLDAALWDAWRHERQALPRLLEAVERGGVAAVRELVGVLGACAGCKPGWLVYGPS